MQAITIQAIITNYQLLAHQDSQIRQQANAYLYSLIDSTHVWIIAKEMISNMTTPDYQLLGAQILYQKVQRDIAQLTLPQINQLKQFVFQQLLNQKLNFATVRKLASSAAMIAINLILDNWINFLPDVVGWMEGSVMQLKSGLALLERLPQELKQNNHIKHNVKMLIRQNLLQHSDLISRVYSSAIMLNQPILTDLALSGLQSWIYVGFPIMKYTELVQLLIGVLNVDLLYLQNCCKILKEGLKYTAREKFQSISQAEFLIEHQKYSPKQMLSLQEIVKYIRSSKLAIFSLIQQGNNSQQIEIYTLIIKEMLLSYGFLLKEQFGYQLIEMLFLVLQRGDLKLSYSTFQFWIEFCNKIEKMKVEKVLQLKFWQIVEHLLDIILQRTILDNQTLYSELLKQDDTLDDITKISLTQYRKQAENLIRFAFDYFTNKKGKQGSAVFFQKLLLIVQQSKIKGQMARGMELALYAVKSAHQSMVKDYDTQNMVVFMTFVMGQLDLQSNKPMRLIAELLNLLKDCNQQMKQTQSLFMRCLDFCLKYVSDDNVSHYAVYAFQALMESISSLGNEGLIDGLMNFYNKSLFNKQTILQKVLEGILTTITKLTNREAIQRYLIQIVNSFQAKTKAILLSNQPKQNYYISLIEIKTLLDAFDHFKQTDREYFRPTFLRISSYGIVIVSRIVHNYITNRIKFTTVGQLGASLGLIRNALKICENTSVSNLPLQQYVILLNIIMSVLTSNSIQIFNEYSDLLDIICKLLSQFVSEKIRVIDDWLISNLPIINSFFISQIQKATMNSIDPDLLKWYFALQQSLLLYSREIYLSQQHTKIYEIMLSSVRFINQRAMQRRAINFLFQCVQMKDVYQDRLEPTLKAVFASIPIMSNLCYLNIGRILVLLLEKMDLKTKENIIRQLLQYQPYTAVSKDLKEVLTKLLAFAIDTKLQRFLKSAVNDLAGAKNKESSSDTALHLQLAFGSWKKQYKRMMKEGNAMNR